jgi:NCS1 family nucleobase:cation symporter-1
VSTKRGQGHYLKAPEAVHSLVDVGNGVIPLFGTILILVSVPAQIGIMSVNTYGAMLTSATMIDGFKKIGTGRRTRITGIVTLMVISVVIALILPDQYLNSFNNFVGSTPLRMVW